jgi:acyl-CoA-dependent ceramide synthase
MQCPQVAKMLNYLAYRTACDVTFGFFLVSWIGARHFGYITLNWAVWRCPDYIPFGCYDLSDGKQGTSSLISTIPSYKLSFYPPGSSPHSTSLPVEPRAWAYDILTNVLQPFVRPTGHVCFNPAILNVFVGLLVGLQVLTLIWFSMILRVAYGVISGKSAEDSRSDVDTDEEVDDMLDEVDMMTADSELKLRPIEQVVTAESLHFTNGSKHANGNGNGNGASSAQSSQSSNSRTRSRRAPLSIPGHGDRKELLGRIGCDKPT